MLMEKDENVQNKVHLHTHTDRQARMHTNTRLHSDIYTT